MNIITKRIMMHHHICSRVYKSHFVCKKQCFLKAIRIGRLLSVVLLPFLINGCMRIGPGMVPRDQFDYAAAIGDAKNQQTLMNIVKMRHSEWPVFLEVSQVVVGYNWEQTGNAKLQLKRFWASDLSDSAEIGYIGKFVERPTITYSPLSGEQFVQNILTPSDPESLFSLIQAGWPADRIFHILVQSVNGKKNRLVMYGTDYQADVEFVRFVHLIRKIHIANALSVRVTQTNGEAIAKQLSFRSNLLDPEIRKELDEVKTMLGLNLNTDTYNMIWNPISEDPNTIAIQTRSVVQVMMAMAANVELPEDHIKASGIIRLKSAGEDSEGSIPPLIRIRSGSKAPGDAFVAVRYRNRWFWVDNNDWDSKNSLAYLTLLLAVTESGDVKGPQLTISAG